MRGDLGVQLRLMLRPRGVLGALVVVAGAIALTAAYLPWYQVAATLEMLGDAQSRAVASLAGWQAHPWGWLVPMLAVVVMILGASLALDRPLPVTRDAQLIAGLALAGVVVAGGLLFPPVSRFDVAGSRLRELADLSGRLPSDVELSFSVRPGVGMWLTLAAATLIVVSSLAVRDRR